MNYDFIRLDDIMKVVDKLPLCSYFIETRKKSERKSVLSWLAVCDKDTLKYINQTYFRITNKVSELNMGDDIFDRETPYKDSTGYDDDEENPFTTEPMDETTDLYTLVVLLILWESSCIELPEDTDIEQAVEEIVEYSVSEILRREGLVTLKGTGLFFDNKFRAVPIKKKKLRKKKSKIKKEIIQKRKK